MKESFRIICVRHEFLFVHVPKTGGISFQTAVFGHTGLGHNTLREYQTDFTAEELGRFFKFAVVRNPWERLFSAFHYLKRGGRNAMDRQWAELHLAEIDDFETFVVKWLDHERLSSIAHLRPQIEFIESGNRSLAIDLIGRYEHIDETYRAVREELIKRGLSDLPRKLPHLNQGVLHDSNYRAAFSSAARDRVKELYHRDIELFGYSFEGNS